ncbi:MAG: hypothetical protein WBK43_11795 [Prolixibacteraceae bacterium]|jgi:hypothetical protein|nr:hypothetical protein [Bacteroidota bacterium]NLS99046.1 hypothetical protein [Bacteroidales bacterium]HNU76749.1 hypothetical protein [Prolixibacteraceae bacterium]HNZ68176.1 hypothetical protein [Prolixibacteraceae bacterium]HOC85577.1 hypothetical protein [Prolixibacteraceae bacterium]
MKTVLQVVLFLLALVLVYLIYASIQRPIQFEKEKDARYSATIERLKDIRKAQIAFKDVHGRFTGSWDTLIHFVKFDSLKLVRKIGNITDSMLEKGITEKKALQMGLIVRDTIRESVLTSVFGEGYNADQLKIIPVSDTVAEFQLGATVIATGSGIKVPVFEAKAHNNIILKGLDDQLRINLNDQRRVQEKYPGLKVGSLTETNNNAGNWE